MRNLLLIGIISLFLAGCAVTASEENTQGVVEEIEMENTIDEQGTGIKEEETSSEEGSLPGELLFDFNPGSEAWTSVDDNVMGGISNSQGKIQEDGTLLFAGTMSLENNGGFSSLRSPWAPIDLSGKDGLLVRVLGDGQVYRLRIRTTSTGREIAFNSFFETSAGEWTTVYIPFEVMIPTYRGFQVGDGPLDSSGIASIGFMLSDKQSGEFSLQVDWIRAVAEEEIYPDGRPSAEG